MGYSFQKYEEYRKVNDLAFDEIPVAWNLQKVKHLFKIGRGRVISQEELDDNGTFPVYSSQTQNNGCLGYIHTYDFDCKQITWTTDGANAGTVFLREGQYNCTNVCGTLQPIKSNLNYHFFLYLLKYVTQFHKRPDTNGAKIMNGEMAAISLCIPSNIEQQKIANFLDHETAKIDTLITKQEKLIELLKEKRQAVISHAVTKGLNPDAPMKDSGVEWLGEVPEHWKIKRLKYLCDIQTGSRNTENAIDNGKYPFFVRSQKVERINSKAFNCEAVLTAGDGVGVGKVYHYINGEFDFHQRVYMLNKFRFTSGMYIFNYLEQNFYKVAMAGQAKSTVDSLRLPLFLNFEITVPPKSEQNEIIKYIEHIKETFDSLMSKTNKAIKLMKERKTALISAAVTGKIDVRDWQE